jgi:hypothetical protein
LLGSHRTASCVFLCSAPFLAAGLSAVRALRVPGIYQALGVIHCAVVCLAAWSLGARVLRTGVEEKRRLALAGTMLVAPFALIALLWVGIGTPWDATPTENRMRYLVLLAGSMSVSSAFVVLKEALADIGECFYSTLGFAMAMFAGAAYLIWLTFHVGIYVVAVHDGQIPPEFALVARVLDILLFAACVMTYLATAAFAASMGRVHWLRRGAARTYVFVNLLALSFIVIRGLAFPNPGAGSTPWYLNIGFIAGIPAVPWIMPFLLGVVLLRRAGVESP